MDKLRIAMLISGGGTTMREILRAVKSGFLTRVEPVLVIASKSDAGGIEKAVAEGISEGDVLVLRPKAYPSPEAFGEAILLECHRRPDFGGPGMYGRRVHCARLYFVRRARRDFFTEATVQRVSPEFDKGALLAFSENRVHELTRPEPLVHEKEYGILAEAKQIAGILSPRG